MVTLASLAAIAWLTLTPAPSTGWGGYEPPWWCLWCGTLGVVDTASNILLFVPLGVGLRLLGLKSWQAMLLALVATVGIEALQLDLVAGRDANVRDVLTNGFGAALGFVVWPHVMSLLFPSRRHAALAAALVAALWVASRVATGLLLQPSPPSGEYVVQIAPISVFPSNFLGIVHAAELNGGAVSVGRLRTQDDLVARWKRDTLVVRATVTAREPTTNLSSVVSVLTRWRLEAFVFGSKGDRLVLRTRLRASDYQLRSPRVELADAITVGEPLELRGAVEGSRVTLRANDLRGGRHEVEVALSAGLGWILVSPFDWPLDALAPIWSGVLAALWAVLLGWYARQATSTRGALGVLAVVSLLAGLLPPMVASAAGAPAAEWIGMIVGAVTGVTSTQRLASWGLGARERGPENARFV